MLRVARQRCGPGVRLVRADMTTLDLGERFDVVTCLFSSIAYVPTAGALRSTVRRLASHLAPGGVLVVEPWFEPDEWEVGHLALLTVDEPDRKAARVSRAGRRGTTSIIDFDYVIADASGTRRVSERHELKLFRFDQYVAAVSAAGLRVEVDDDGLFGRGLVLGVREEG
jgi:SAM-dependent methyltransferase